MNLNRVFAFSVMVLVTITLAMIFGAPYLMGD